MKAVLMWSLLQQCFLIEFTL